jgi:hypothetical protein
VPLVGFVLLVESPPRASLVLLWFGFASAAVVAALVRPSQDRWALLVVLLPPVVLLVELGLPGRFSFARRVLQPTSFVDDGGLVVERLEAVGDGRVFSYATDRPGDIPYLVRSMRPNANALFGIRSVDGYDGGVQVTTRWAEAMRSLTGGTFDGVQTVKAMAARPFDAERFARLGVRWAVIETSIAPAEDVVPEWSGPVVTEGTLELWENPAYGGEAIVWYASSRRSSQREIADALTPPAPGTAEQALVEPGGPILACAAPCPPDAVPVQRPAPGHVVTSVEASRPALVALAEQYDSGWRASVDGVRVPVVPVDGLLVGVEVPAGVHTIELVYRPPHWTLAWCLTLVGLLLTAALAIVDVVRGRRGSPRPVTT